jgi:hypothetical protein
MLKKINIEKETLNAKALINFFELPLLLTR